MTVRRLSSARASVTSSSSARNITGARCTRVIRSSGISRTASAASNCCCSTTVPPRACIPPMIAIAPTWNIGMLISPRSALPDRISAFMVNATRRSSALPEDAAFRGAGGAAGEQQAGDVVGPRRERVLPAVAACDELLEVDHPADDPIRRWTPAAAPTATVARVLLSPKRIRRSRTRSTGSPASARRASHPATAGS